MQFHSCDHLQNASFTLVFYQGVWKRLNLPMHCMYMMHKGVLLIGSENQLHQQDKYRILQVINSGLQICKQAKNTYSLDRPIMLGSFISE